MSSTYSKKIVLIGAGNVATHLSKLFLKKGHEIIQVYSKTEDNARNLGLKLFTTHTTNLRDLNLNADIYVICVKDEAIPEVAAQLKLKNKLILHTSGSVPLSVLSKCSNKFGVLYPLQTFSKEAKFKWSKTPLLIEANTAKNKAELKEFCLSLSKNNVELNSEQRLKLHLAAVFTCNFSNHLYTLAERYLEAEKLNLFHLLLPLIQQTARKIKKLSPAEAQTGPASRKDKNVINAHLKLLKNYQSHKMIYELLTQSILSTSNK